MSRNAGPIGSAETIALTCAGRASAVSQPIGPPEELVTRIAGPISSSRAAPHACSSACASAQSREHRPRAGGERADGRVVRVAGSGPLLRVATEERRDRLQCEDAARRAEHVRVVRRAAVAGAVDDVDGIALLERGTSPSPGGRPACRASRCPDPRRRGPGRSGTAASPPPAPPTARTSGPAGPCPARPRAARRRPRRIRGGR